MATNTITAQETNTNYYSFLPQNNDVELQENLLNEEIRTIQYENGQSLENQNEIDQAISWYKLAAENGHPEAQYGLGLLLLKNEDPQDRANGIYFLELAAYNGIIDAQTTLGITYFNGEKVQKDLKKSAFWIKMAYDQGDDVAQTVWHQEDLKNYY